jgi:hypothetical protein
MRVDPSGSTPGPATLRSSELLDVERAETSNIRSIERKQQSPLFSNLLQKTTESFFRIYPGPSPPAFSPSASRSEEFRRSGEEEAGGEFGELPAPARSARRGTAAKLPGPNRSSLLSRPEAARRGLSESSASGSAHRERLRGYLTATSASPHMGADGARKRPSLRAVARQIQIANAWSRPDEQRSSSSATPAMLPAPPPPPAADSRTGAEARTAPTPNRRRNHRRTSSAAEILQAIQSGPEAEGEPLLAFREDDGSDESEDVPSPRPGGDDAFAETSPDLLRSPVLEHKHETNYGSLDRANSDESASFVFDEEDDEDEAINKRLQRYSLSRRIHQNASALPWLTGRLWLLCRPLALGQGLVAAVLRSAIPWVAIPLFMAALVLYYPIGNPRFDFLPGEATLSWWFNFLGRQTLMMELSRLTSWVVMDLLVTTRCGARLLGSHVTFFCLQGSGWPSVIAFWGIWDLLLLHGDNRFQTHWFYWTRWRIYSVANSGRYILTSNLYLRTLLSMIFLGVATAVKRTALAIRFGNRQLGK